MSDEPTRARDNETPATIAAYGLIGLAVVLIGGEMCGTAVAKLRKQGLSLFDVLEEIPRPHAIITEPEGGPLVG